jgi:hypothetical protein
MDIVQKGSGGFDGGRRARDGRSGNGQWVKILPGSAKLATEERSPGPNGPENECGAALKG